MIDEYAACAKYLIDRLQDEIFDYHLQHGEEPKFIMATARAYSILQHYAEAHFWLRNTGGQAVPLFKGIEIRAVSGNGAEVFLCGEPISLRE